MTNDNNQPRLLSRQAAAAYLGVSVSTFHGWVKCGRMPAPVFGSKRWDREAIDAALDRESGIASSVKPETEYQRRKRERALEETPLQKWRRETGYGA
ncbi:helix-turn-helix transcriptional regulator [Chelativorans alearense]|uniref:helix-turn-helix transcriptional regulator n=1 Tax=Chelativorans alearense TaxID=2681495 RepID=UPI0013D1C006|nr:hypothetical protein [Chelativorans alearense]